MKTTIAGKFIRRNAVMIGIFLIVVGIGLFWGAKRYLQREVKDDSREILRIVKHYIEDELKDHHYGLNRDSLQNLNKEIESLCTYSDLDYIYILMPHFETGTLEYLLCCSKEELREDEQEIDNIDLMEKETVTKEEKAVWNGGKEFFSESSQSEDGYEYDTVTLVQDSQGNKALLGCSIFYKALMLRTIKVFLIMLFCMLLAVIGVSLIEYIQLRKIVSIPARVISNAMSHYVKNGHDNREILQVKGQDEFSMIASAYNTMTEEIASYISDIQIMTKEKERQNAEMQIAADIQAGLLPDCHTENEIYRIDACMYPAKDVGGDMYDYVQLDENRTMIMIADVCGKGITAGLFMSRSLTLIRYLAQNNMTTAEIMSHTNRELCAYNPQDYFVTAFIGIYDKSTGIFTYTNAGHNNPYLIRDEVIMLKGNKSLALGAMDEIRYRVSEISLQEGDIIYLYTDGVNEAENVDGEQYGTGTIEKELLHYRNSKRERNMVEHMNHSLNQFAGAASQSDDITMLVFELI